MKVLTFAYENNNYSLYYEDNKFIYKKNEEIIESKEEKDLINNVFKQVFPKGNIKNLGQIEIGNKVYVHKMTEDNHYHLFYEVKNGILTIPNDSMRWMLDRFFNNEQLLAYLKNHDLEDKWVKRIAKIGKKSLVVLLLAGNLLSYSCASRQNSTLPSPEVSVEATAEILASIEPETKEEKLEFESRMDATNYFIENYYSEDIQNQIKEIYQNNPNLQDKIILFKVGNYDIALGYKNDFLTVLNAIQASDYNVVKESEYTDFYATLHSIYPDTEFQIMEQPALNFEMIENAIQSNPNLGVSEQLFMIYNLKEFWQDNLKYMDMSVVDNLKNCRIEYINDRQLMGENNEKRGSWSYDNKIITIYGSNDLDTLNICSLLHEVIHASTKKPQTSLGFKTMEYITSLFNKEYNKNEDERAIEIYNAPYNWLETLVKPLLELLDVDTVKEAYFNSDIEIIINELNQIIPDEAMAIELLSNIDAYHEAYINSNFDAESIDLLESLKSKVRDSITKYYEAKTNSLISTNEEIMFMWHPADFLSSIAPSVVTSDLAIQNAPYNYMIARKKYYLNETYLNEDNKTIIGIGNAFKRIEYETTLEDLISEQAAYLQGDQVIIVVDNVYQKEDGKYYYVLDEALPEFNYYGLKSNLEEDNVLK